jgi:hypothetical protein
MRYDYFNGDRLEDIEYLIVEFEDEIVCSSMID